MVVTRPLPGALRTAGRLRRLGHDPVLSPVLVVRATGAALPEGPFAAVLATSAQAFADDRFGPDLLRTPLFAVGEATAAAAREAGFAQVEAEGGRAADLAEAVVGRLPAGAKLLYLAGRARTPTLERVLTERGFSLAVVETYAAEPAESLTPQAAAALRAGETTVLHYSPRSAALFLDLAIRGGLADAVLRAAHLCLSDAVAAPLRERGAAARVAEKPDEDALLALLARPG